MCFYFTSHLHFHLAQIKHEKPPADSHVSESRDQGTWSPASKVTCKCAKPQGGYLRHTSQRSYLSEWCKADISQTLIDDWIFVLAGGIFLAKAAILLSIHCNDSDTSRNIFMATHTVL